MYKKICVRCKKEFDGNRQAKWCTIKCKILDKITVHKLTGCWIWPGARNFKYGKLRWEKKWLSSHRAAYESFIGEIPEGKVVCHKCDNKICCNPDHLWIGTHKENVKDAIEKGLWPKRRDNYFSKYTDDQIEEIKKLRKEGMTIKRICRIFNCSGTYVCKICKE